VLPDGNTAWTQQPASNEKLNKKGALPQDVRHESLSQPALLALKKTAEVMRLGHYSAHSVQNYLRELRYIFDYFTDTKPSRISQQQIEDYLIYIKDTFNAQRDKCRMVAQAWSFFCKKVIKKPFLVPNTIYPRKTFSLPNVMSQEEVSLFLNSCTSIKQLAMAQLFYSTGIRLAECCNLKIEDIDSTHMRIKIRQGKGSRDRFTLLSVHTLKTLRSYYAEHRTKTYLFEGQTPGKPMHQRSVQHALELIFTQAGLRSKGYNTHTLRHSFATHLLDNGSDIHTIKELLGHSKIETTMVYLHLQSRKRAAIISPLDSLLNGHPLETIPFNNKKAVQRSIESLHA
jgi:site-specific recombinase XerD